ncbi:MAG TPA: ISAs1 family transposase [Anaerolineales bacterium]
MSTKGIRPTAEQQLLLDEVQVRLGEPQDLPRIQSLLRRHHYLGMLRPVGERLFYVAVDGQGEWVGALVFCAAAKYLRHRDHWIGWTGEQRRRRLALVVNNARFLLVPNRTVPNLGSRVLRLTLGRLSQDWVRKYGHPVLAVETFVDPEQFCGTVYRANGWEELGLTDGWGRCGRDYYVKHDKPKRLFVRELCHQARRSLQAEHLKPALAMVEAKVPPRCTQRVGPLRSLAGYFKQVPEFRARIESYPLWSLLAIVACATLCDAPRGPKALAGFAKKLSQAQRRALGIRSHPLGRYPAPSQPTFSRLLKRVDLGTVNQAVLSFQSQVRGQPSQEELVALDGKQPKHGGGPSILTAVTTSTQHYLGSALVDKKTNEIPVARQLFEKLDLEGRFVSLDALHTQTETALDLVQEHGAHYLLTVKDNQPGLHQTIQKALPEVPAAFPPWGLDEHTRLHSGAQQKQE